MLSIAFVATFAISATRTSISASTDVYWWHFVKADCGYDDVSPQPSCGHAGKGDVAALKACCLATTGCGGFNTNGIIKKTDCLDHKKDEPACDLYVKEGKPQPPPPPPSVNWPPLWPLPKLWSNGTALLVLAQGFHIVQDVRPGQNSSAFLAAAIARYEKLMFAHVSSSLRTATTGGELRSVRLSVESEDDSHPQLETNESYSLWLGASGGGISAPTVYGALRGLETLSQLVQFNFSTGSYLIPGAPWRISDEPRFPHRGLMIDTSRHFETLATIRKVVDSLPYAKINVLHWHMSDSQSFPLQSTSAPRLWMGAYSPQERYTQADVASIVEHARLRGVRVMVEFDMPGHAGSWCKGYPAVCPSPSCTQPLNVASNATFELITNLLLEMTGGKLSTPGAPSGLFPEGLLHLGGDEVNTACWTSSPSISAWLAARSMTADDGYAYFVKRAATIAIEQGRRPVQWVEVFDHFHSALDKKTIVHVWKDKSTLTQVVAAGYNALINNSPGDDSWYLDHLSIPWDAVYGNEPCADISDASECKLVLGGQGEMWGETVDSSDIEQTVWPRLAAIAERLWSPREALVSPAAAHARILAFRCLLNRRGVAAAPVDNPNARTSPPGPGGCFDQ